MPHTLSLTGKRWIIPQTEHVSSHALIATLLAHRNVGNATELPAPSVYPDMERAVARIRLAMERGETIGIFGDYDCDGITGVAQLVRFFRRHSVHPHVILPHRVHDGYGLRRHAVEAFGVHGITLLITVDTGITAVAEIGEAKKKWGIDVIITDHHHLQEELPPAFAILHPLLAPAFPPPHPSGAGVAHSLIRGLEGKRWEGDATDHALAMIGTIGDLVELKGTNRTLVQRGLAALNELTSGPLALFADSVRSGKNALTSTDIAFRLAPRINAAGRMEDPSIALTALLEGGEALKELSSLNTLRQESTVKLLEESYRLLGLPEQFDPSVLATLPPLLFSASPAFPEGIIGLIAGRLTEMYGRPSFVASVSNGECTASLRSVRAYHITQGLERVSDLLSTFGGHAQAAGCTFALKNLEELKHRLTEDVAAHVNPVDLRPALEIDAILSPNDISLSFCEQLRHLEPFGQGNPEPFFLLKNIRLEQPRRVGKEGAHLQGRIAGFKVIGFRLGHLAEEATHPLDVICKLSIDTWNGNRAPQLIVEDVCTARRAERAIIARHGTA
ncbi:MAG: DHH family phosphoesterase [Candidatus Peribacteraceae bacterium]|nr:DHH family phosphoesterase [Candidatus Peribacteraceae bacterium]MDD5074559.1 DHH family phosphoesterase [Candidatus Peribacteraceae bacterium]